MLLGLILGTLIVCSTALPPIAWLGLELNMICFLGVALISIDAKKSAMLYYILQSLGSLVILLASILGLLVPLIFGIVIKLGIIPVHFWVRLVISPLSKRNLFIFLRWQKLAPLIILINRARKFTFFALLNVWFGAYLISALSTPIYLLIVSGFIQLGWITVLYGYVFFYFIFLYFIILIPAVCFMLSPNPSFTLAIRNIAGIPPFTGFWIKLKALYIFRFFLSTTLLIGNRIAIIRYIRLIINPVYTLTNVSPILVLPLVLGIFSKK